MRHAMVWTGGDARVKYMMNPAVRTIADGLYECGFNVTVGNGMRRLLHHETNTPFLYSLGAGDAMVWVGIYDLQQVTNMLVKLGQSGAFTAYYATESHELWDRDCSYLRGLPVTEVWQYSSANAYRCPSQTVEKPVRVLPPGYYDPVGPAWRPGMHSVPPQSAPPSPSLKAPGKSVRVVFLGSFRYSIQRRDCIKKLNSHLESPVTVVEDVYNDAGWRRHSDTMRESAQPVVYVNVHKQCNTTTTSSFAACETFRFSLILSSGADVVSDHCHSLDEALYDGFVNYMSVMDMPKAAGSIARQQHADGPRRALARASEFATRFAPLALFERAGLVTLFARSNQTATRKEQKESRRRSQGGGPSRLSRFGSIET